MADNNDNFPQADNIERIFQIISITDVNDLKNEAAMTVILNDISGRQVRYYINAAQFLGVLDKDKCFTQFGNELRNCNLFEQKIKIAQKIMAEPTFSEVYFTELILGAKLEKDEVVAIMKKNIVLCSDSLYRRRAQTVMRWVEWINSIDEYHVNN